MQENKISHRSPLWGRFFCEEKELKTHKNHYKEVERHE